MAQMAKWAQERLRGEAAEVAQGEQEDEGSEEGSDDDGSEGSEGSQCPEDSVLKSRSADTLPARNLEAPRGKPEILAPK